MPKLTIGLATTVLAITGCADTAGGPRSSYACAECTVDLEELANIGSSSDSASVTEGIALQPCAVAQLSEDRFAVATLHGGGQLAVYDASTRTVQYWGREGAGPGEYKGNPSVIAARDSLYVIDSSNLRVSVLSKSGEFARSFSLPHAVGAGSVLVNGEVVTVRRSSRRDSSDNPMSIHSSAGELTATIDPDSSVTDREWLVSARRNGGFWSMHPRTLRLVSFTASGQREHTVRFAAAWFDNARSEEGGFPEVAPPPTVTHFSEDESGLLWISVLVPRDPWVPPETPRVTIEALREMFDVRIIAGDPQTGEILSEVKHDMPLGGVCGQSVYVEQYRQSEVETGLRILRARFSRQ